jgi:hypothetical protein
MRPKSGKLKPERAEEERRKPETGDRKAETGMVAGNDGCYDTEGVATSA